MDSTSFNSDRQVVQCLLELRTDLHATSALGHGVLHHAANAGRADCTNYYLDIGVDVRQRGFMRDTPLTELPCSVTPTR